MAHAALINLAPLGARVLLDCITRLKELIRAFKWLVSYKHSAASGANGPPDSKRRRPR